MRKLFGWAVVIVVAGVAAFIYQKMKTTEPVVVPPVAEAPPQPAEPAIQHPLPQDPSTPPLPALKESDNAVTTALATGLGDAVRELFKTDALIHRVVATVDNLPRPKVAMRVMPVNSAPGLFRTIGNGEDYTVRPDNAERYRAYVSLVRAVDTEKLVALYVRFYPLFQQAYEELGYPGAYFNDRLVAVIDHLLAAPDMPADVKLVQPKVFYQFADDDLEKRSAGEKIMMRIGRDNAAIVKVKLREIRSAITEAAPAR
jgi:Protein of unknown function (DUF3014)